MEGFLPAVLDPPGGRPGHGVSHFHHAEFNIACAYALLHRPIEAVEWLQKTADDGLPCYPLLANDPCLKELQGYPPYRSLVGKLKDQWEYFQRSF